MNNYISTVEYWNNIIKNIAYNKNNLHCKFYNIVF